MADPPGRPVAEYVREKDRRPPGKRAYSPAATREGHGRWHLRDPDDRRSWPSC